MQRHAIHELLGIVLALGSMAAHGTDVLTRCDELASHPLDPDRVTTGVSSSEVRVVESIAACRDAVAADPDNARLNYQLGRVYFYDGQTDAAMPHLEQSAATGHRQAQFVLGYVIDEGMQGVEQDACRVEDLWARSARAGRLAAMVSYPHHVLRGRFAGCQLQLDDAEMLNMLEAATARKLDYYQRVLVGDLIEDLGARIAARDNGRTTPP
ncbi:MAG: tetratricopeptide repeat protein [Gammaproteobacteria bacterium]|nr:tetratricopeptide repeat protein [Gammaproteobacteria bacterium]